MNCDCGQFDADASQRAPLDEQQRFETFSSHFNSI